MAQRLRPVLDGMCVPYEVVAVDDGSLDGTAAVLHGVRRTWRELRIARLYRNCGHQAALTVGLKRAKGTYLVSIDADLQDPPEKIPEMVQLARGSGCLCSSLCVFTVVACWDMVRRSELAYGLLLAVIVIPAVLTHLLQSFGRYTAVAFPLFFWLAQRLPPRWLPIVAIVFAAGQAVLAALFFLWYVVF